MESKNNVAAIIAGIGVVGVMAAGAIGYTSGKEQGMQAMHMGMMNMRDKKEITTAKSSMDHSSMTMDEMTQGLDGLTGDAFDKAFVEMMIVHHQGAVDMAELIPANAKHAELKKLGQDIIVAQTTEITMMKQWLKSWGYETEPQKGEDQMTEKEMMDKMMPGMKH
jgi:uncharacterized protein (DUF305 family)